MKHGLKKIKYKVTSTTFEGKVSIDIIHLSKGVNINDLMKFQNVKIERE